MLLMLLPVPTTDMASTTAMPSSPMLNGDDASYQDVEVGAAKRNGQQFSGEEVVVLEDCCDDNGEGNNGENKVNDIRGSASAQQQPSIANPIVPAEEEEEDASSSNAAAVPATAIDLQRRVEVLEGAVLSNILRNEDAERIEKRLQDVEEYVRKHVSRKVIQAVDYYSVHHYKQQQRHEANDDTFNKKNKKKKRGIGFLIRKAKRKLRYEWFKLKLKFL